MDCEEQFRSVFEHAPFSIHPDDLEKTQDIELTTESRHAA
jgi:hypothetical protein